MTPQLSIKDHLYSAKATSWDLCPEKCLLEHTFFCPWPLPPLSGGIFHVHFFFPFSELCGWLTWSQGGWESCMCLWVLCCPLPSSLSFLPSFPFNEVLKENAILCSLLNSLSSSYYILLLLYIAPLISMVQKHCVQSPAWVHHIVLSEWSIPQGISLHCCIHSHVPIFGLLSPLFVKNVNFFKKKPCLFILHPNFSLASTWLYYVAL